MRTLVRGARAVRFMDIAEDSRRMGYAANDFKHLVESLNWQLYWFDRYLDGKINAVPPDAR